MAKHKSIYRCYSNIIKTKFSFNKCGKLKLNVKNSVLFVILIIICVKSAYCQYPSYTTRDPRWYSREGVFDYFPPNPGDPDYK